MRPAAWWRRAGVLLIVAAAWTAVVWVNRLANLAVDDRGAAFIAVHAVLAGVSLALAVPVAFIGWRLVRSAGRAGDGGGAGTDAG